MRNAKRAGSQRANADSVERMTRNERSGRLALAFLPWGFYVLLLTPGPWQAVLFAPARFKEWVGLPCPLCGGTRATWFLLLGDWMQALYLNPMALVVLAGSILWTAGCVWEVWRGRKLLPRWERFSGRAGKWVLAGVLLFWIYHASAAALWPKEELLNRQGIFFRL